MIGCSGPISKPPLPPTMSWDKMVDRAIGAKHVALGIILLTKTLDITVEDYKVQPFLVITQDVWAAKRTCFMAIDAS